MYSAIISAWFSGENPSTDPSTPNAAIIAPPGTPGAATITTPSIITKWRNVTKSCGIPFKRRIASAHDVIFNAEPERWIVAQSGTVNPAILSETPEIYGAEHLLTRRAATREVGEKLVGIIKWWEDYTERARMSMNNNPSPGNKAGGLTTILEKSLEA